MGISGFYYQLRIELLVYCFKFYCVFFRDLNVSIYWVFFIFEYFADSDIDEYCQCIVKISGLVFIFFKKKELVVWNIVGYILGINFR